MKGLSYLLAGSLAVSSAGCSEYKAAGEYSCELFPFDDEVTARNGKKQATYFKGSFHHHLEYDNLPAEEALKAVKACSEAFGRKVE